MDKAEVARFPSDTSWDDVPVAWLPGASGAMQARGRIEACTDRVESPPALTGLTISPMLLRRRASSSFTDRSVTAARSIPGFQPREGKGDVRAIVTPRENPR